MSGDVSRGIHVKLIFRPDRFGLRRLFGGRREVIAETNSQNLTGTAFCHPNDEWDDRVGTLVAASRLADNFARSYMIPKHVKRCWIQTGKNTGIIYFSKSSYEIDMRHELSVDYGIKLNRERKQK